MDVAASTSNLTPGGIGAKLERKEDDRFLRGRGQFIGDLRRPHMKEAMFVRSPLAHARIVSISIPDDLKDDVFTAADLKGVKPISARSLLSGFRSSAQTALATEKVRYVGEPVALCLASSRAEAEDMASRVDVQYEELAAIVDSLQARDCPEPRVHETWTDNIYLESVTEAGPPPESVGATISVRREFRTARQCMSPLEGKGALAYKDTRLDQLVFTTSTQMPHVVRTGLSEFLALDQERVRVIAPDVGGGFGYKGVLSPEELCVAWAALTLEVPIRWIEDRREHLTGNANCREQWYSITLHADARGRLLAIDAEAVVNAGAYGAYPFGASGEAGQIASLLPGPYDFQSYRCKTWSVATNKPPLLPYRGVARPGVCFALESMMDLVARAVGREPYEVRLDNLIRPDQMPFDNIVKKHIDSGDYPECLRRAVEAINLTSWRERQKKGEADGRHIGVGLCIFNEQGAHGMSVYAGWGVPVLPGYEQATVRLLPDGGLEVRVGIQSHGQGLETTLSQVAHEILGIHHSRIVVLHGDTSTSPYSVGTYASRSMVMAGGAVAAACRQLRDRAVKIGSHLLQVPQTDADFVAGEVRANAASISLREIAECWYKRPYDLPSDVDRGGLEVTAGYKTERDSGTFSYASHAVAVAVDPISGDVELLDYVVVEDGGVLVNPMIVDGQIIGGVAQGIGTALFEEMLFDSTGQPLGSTLADYLLPGATEMLDVRIFHMETPSPYSEFGMKGIGESGAIGPPAAILNAINDAISVYGAEVHSIPVTPRRIVEAIHAAQGGHRDIAGRQDLQ
ncbi:xanthine dehydrogenase family protein molybdopterin-binding subunit [Mesorhizobium sp. CO1-1-8]|uniref:xanthine dehydrogenase family protein molybdopterin-binding subunit n=1 Tax=Mesorhizobium sp. CO1-1-8 TaxID=2876631 RepID=UPI001CD096EA|nr:xanthine dehydrogenase family protein molybdopterin-binding subunit [Mesorhizobium sp. CO1-1-8]MBZ9772416.1 xanthine dehydrogenase family protein molybdopterin-binding subunit [Mesorhizobium sp. CO1-1-8]